MAAPKEHTAGPHNTTATAATATAAGTRPDAGPGAGPEAAAGDRTPGAGLRGRWQRRGTRRKFFRSLFGPAEPPPDSTSDGLTSSQRRRRRAAFRRAQDTSLSVDAFAYLTGTDPAKVHQDVTRAHTLWGFHTGGGHKWLLPVWQLDGEQVIAGIGAVNQTLPKELHPAVAESIVCDPSDTLTINGEPASIRDWLIAGGDVDLAVAAAHDALTTATL